MNVRTNIQKRWDFIPFREENEDEEKKVAAIMWGANLALIFKINEKFYNKLSARALYLLFSR